MGIGLQLMFYATPIVYSLDVIHQEVLGVDPRDVLVLNPLTHFVEAMRASVYLLHAPSLRNWIAWRSQRSSPRSSRGASSPATPRGSSRSISTWPT